MHRAVLSAFSADQQRDVLTISIEPRVREQEIANLQTDEVQSAFRKERHEHGRFWYRFPTGESGADVYHRVASWWQSLLSEIDNPDRKNYDNVVVITHGLTMRFLAMWYFKWSPDTFETVWNPGNCEMWVLERGEDGKYQFTEPDGHSAGGLPIAVCHLQFSDKNGKEYAVDEKLTAEHANMLDPQLSNATLKSLGLSEDDVEKATVRIVIPQDLLPKQSKERKSSSAIRNLRAVFNEIESCVREPSVTKSVCQVLQNLILHWSTTNNPQLAAFQTLLEGCGWYRQTQQFTDMTTPRSTEFWTKIWDFLISAGEEDIAYNNNPYNFLGLFWLLIQCSSPVDDGKLAWVAVQSVLLRVAHFTKYRPDVSCITSRLEEIGWNTETHVWFWPPSIAELLGAMDYLQHRITRMENNYHNALNGGVTMAWETSVDGQLRGAPRATRTVTVYFKGGTEKETLVIPNYLSVPQPRTCKVPHVLDLIQDDIRKLGRNPLDVHAIDFWNEQYEADLPDPCYPHWPGYHTSLLSGAASFC
eukprot:TRINITY_DN65817_c0_g1_i1.p1 TRINITY_DN65817_c0_g1~~TRINITY_DN65817_c0_g1_i1.p1  ORF type:complete len:530 (-),score=42.05 TRINITY_DN65817_c0_g1_i1:36-1625(-)